MYSTLNQSLGKPLLVTWLQALSLLVKVPLTIWFAFGGLGLRAAGRRGLRLGHRAGELPVPGLRRVAAAHPAAVPSLRHLAAHGAARLAARSAISPRLGVPGGLAVMVEVTSFTLMALFIARQGVLATAAHQVAANLAAVLYMVPLSIAIATSARVSYWLGAANASRARLAIRTGFKLGLALALALAADRGPGPLAHRRHLLAQSRGGRRGGRAAGLARGLPHRATPPRPCACSCCAATAWRWRPWSPTACCSGASGLAGGYALAYHQGGAWTPRHSPAAFWAAATVALALLSVILPVILWRAVRSYRPAS